MSEDGAWGDEVLLRIRRVGNDDVMKRRLHWQLGPSLNEQCHLGTASSSPALSSHCAVRELGQRLSAFQMASA